MPNAPGGLLGGALARSRVAAVAILLLWTAVLWTWRMEQSGQSGNSAQVAAPIASRPTPMQGPGSASGLVPVASSGQRTPIGGVFDRFDVSVQPIVAPVNASGQTAFYASLLRVKATEGIFLAAAGRVEKIAAVGDPVPGGGMLSGFAKHPMPALNDAGSVAFGAAVTSANGGEGLFLVKDSVLKTIAMAGGEAPFVPGGTFVEFDAPALNDNDDVAFVATVRRGRDTFQALYQLSNGRLRKLVAEGDPVLGGGHFDRFGLVSINNRGVIAFPATVDHGPVLGGIFVTGTRDLKMLAGVGALAPDGRMLVRISEHVAIDDDDDIAFGAQIGLGKDSVEAVMKVNTAGIALIAASGDAAPGGGRFSGFGPWPGPGPAGRIAFIAGVEGGPGSIGVYAWQSGELRPIVTVGEPLPGGGVLPAFAINSVTSSGGNGAVTFATMGGAETEGSRIWYLGPATK